MKKRVWTLYRVSTLSQANNHDITLQRKACLSFIGNQNNSIWSLEREFRELAVSGYKYTVNERNRLKRILEGAKQQEFDILLVFMFDRLGRNSEEMQGLIEQVQAYGIQIWSVIEGQWSGSNYSYFGQAALEVERTSQRVKQRLRQMNEEGIFTGGTAPYGYKLIENSNGKKSLVIDQKEAKVILYIFNLALNHQYGCSKIAQQLNHLDIKTRNNKTWIYNTVSRLLRNPVYIGRPAYNKYKEKGHKIVRDKWKLQPKNHGLSIVPEGQFYQVQEMMEGRKPAGRTNEQAVGEDFLLAEIVICAYCGKKLKAENNYNRSKSKVTGKIKKTIYRRYVCEHAKNKQEFHGQRDFGADKYEGLVVKEVLRTIRAAKEKGFTLKSEEMYSREFLLKQNPVEGLKQDIKRGYQDLFTLKGQATVLSVLKEQEDKLAELNDKLLLLEEEMNHIVTNLKELKNLRDELEHWEQKFSTGSMKIKKEMIKRVIQHAELRKNDLVLELNVDVSNRGEIKEAGTIYEFSSYSKQIQVF
ncbi:DNA invertase Pin-like site-specific DNA recombinase/DNA-binding transcriptional MerR regulator [Bacillus fengqiuensis]|nr:DNA invertase Pin-like site-specific DNA recombinase/DNA-binding transcriptional MerR regulator [Bacillus fengqiuensis]